MLPTALALAGASDSAIDALGLDGVSQKQALFEVRHLSPPTPPFSLSLCMSFSLFRARDAYQICYLSVSTSYSVRIGEPTVFSRGGNEKEDIGPLASDLNRRDHPSAIQTEDPGFSFWPSRQ